MFDLLAYDSITGKKMIRARIMSCELQNLIGELLDDVRFSSAANFDDESSLEQFRDELELVNDFFEGKVPSEQFPSEESIND